MMKYADLQYSRQLPRGMFYTYFAKKRTGIYRGTSQKKQGRKRGYDDIKNELAAKAGQETRRLICLQDNSEDGTACFSAIQTILWHRGRLR